MRRHITLSLLLIALAAPQAAHAQDLTQQLVKLERGALDRWSKGDTGGYMDLYTDDVSYFDPFTEKRVEGKAAMIERYKPFDGKFSIARYEILNPVAIASGNIAALSFNLVNYNAGPDGKEKVLNRWNCTEIYRRTNGQWKIAHSHWSFTTPEFKTPQSP
jgi:ketosteroid isomerase-like protein